MSSEVGQSDEELRKIWKPEVSEELAYQVLDVSYVPKGGSRKVIKQLDSYDDVNFWVEIDHVPYLLKVHNGVESLDYLKVLEAAEGDHFKAGNQGSIIHFQTAIMKLLQSHQISASVPRPPLSATHTQHAEGTTWPEEQLAPVSAHELPTVSGKTRRLVVRLLTWTVGKPMSDVKFLPVECLYEAGKALGRISTAFSNFGSETDMSLATPAQRYHQWDGQRTADLANFVQYIPDERRQGMIKSILDRFNNDLLKSGDAEKFRKGILHGDFNDANIVLDDDLAFAGVIDFGDSVESWRVLDVTIAMAYSMLSVYGKSNRMVSAAASLLCGFNTVCPLVDIERKHLVLLVACRLACSVTLGAYSYQQNPGNEYLLLHAEPAWEALELIWGYDDDKRAEMSTALELLFDRACDGSCDKDWSDLCVPDPCVVDTLEKIRKSGSTDKKRKRSDPGVITFVTGNKKKLEEVKRILKFDDSSSYRLENLKVDLPELQGDPIDIAKEKCRLAAAKVGGPVITEDTSLCFNALNGLPGPYIKWFLDGCGLDGLNKMLAGYEDKTAYAQTVVAYSIGAGEEPLVFDGRTSGKVVSPRGKLDFGWDPVFEPDEGAGKTYAEMNKDEKDAISHRSRAFSSLRACLQKARST